jgi:hypothetical protein
MHGVVVGVPYGISEPAAVDYAGAVSDHIGAGLVAAYGFAAKRIPVFPPLVGNFASSPRDQGSALQGGGSIYPVFKNLLRTVASGQIEIYLAIEMIRKNPGGVPATNIIVSDFGKIETLPGRHKTGVVIGAPHGSFDVYTAGMAQRICSRTGIAGVIATGFTPTETQDHARINVNRPTERYMTFSDREFETARAKMTYEQFKNSVLSAARGELALYIDLHQNGGTRIEVATVGISKAEARFIRNTYSVLRNQALAVTPELTAVDLAIEPLDELEVGAWATKTNGILTLAARGLHFELPANGVMGTAHHREIYTEILGELIRRISDALTTAK